MQNVFIAPAMQHGCHAKPLFLFFYATKVMQHSSLNYANSQG